METSPRYFGVDESGSNNMLIVACVSPYPYDAIRTKLKKVRGFSEEGFPYNGRQFRFAHLNRGNMKSEEWFEYRVYAIAALLKNLDIESKDKIYIDSFGCDNKITRALLRELRRLKIYVPKEHIICKPKADETYFIVNLADKLASRLHRIFNNGHTKEELWQIREGYGVEI